MCYYPCIIHTGRSNIDYTMLSNIASCQLCAFTIVESMASFTSLHCVMWPDISFKAMQWLSWMIPTCQYMRYLSRLLGLVTTSYYITGVLGSTVPQARLSACMLISHKGHNNTIHVYSVTVIWPMLKHCRPDNLARGHLSLLHRAEECIMIISMCTSW